MAIITSSYLSKSINGIVINKNYPCNVDNYSNNNSRDVKYVVIHYTGNQKDSALNNCKYFQSPNRSASAHFFCDEDNIYQSVELRDSAWHCGCSKGYKTSCRNTNSFGIEMCTSGNYTVAEKTQLNAAYLCAELCKMIGITPTTVDTYVLRHYDVVLTNKSCPAQFVKDTSQWTRFKEWVKNILTYGTHTVPEPTKTTTYTKKKFIKQVQKAIGAEVDGIVGNETLSKLIVVSKTKNSTHAVVKPLQKFLKKKGFYSGKITGVFDENTRKAVKSYKIKKKLLANGKVTKKTWKKLFGIL